MIVKIFTVYIICIYLLITRVDTLKKKNGNKYLIFNSTDENKKLLTKYNDVRNEIKDKIKENNSDKCDYEKDCMKIKLNSDDNLPLNKPSKLCKMTIIIRCVFSEDDKPFHKFL